MVTRREPKAVTASTLHSPLLTTLWCVLAAALIPTHSASGAVQDNGRFFDPNVVANANSDIQQMKQQFGKDVVIETYDAMPGMPAEAMNDPALKGTFFQTFIEGRARSIQGDALVIVISRRPARIQAGATANFHADAFTDEDASRLSMAFSTRFRNQQYDQGLVDAIESIRSTLANKEHPAKGGVSSNDNRQGPAAGAPPLLNRISRQEFLGYLCFAIVAIPTVIILVVVRIYRTTAAAASGVANWADRNRDGTGITRSGWFQLLLLEMAVGVAAWRIAEDYVARVLGLWVPPLTSTDAVSVAIMGGGLLITLFIATSLKKSKAYKIYVRVCGGAVAARLAEYSISGGDQFLRAVGGGMILAGVLAESNIMLDEGSMSEKVYESVRMTGIKAFIGVLLGIFAAALRSRFPMPAPVDAKIVLYITVPTFILSLILPRLTRHMADPKRQWTSGRVFLWHADTVVIGILASLFEITSLTDGYYRHLPWLYAAGGILTGLIVGGVVGGISGVVAFLAPKASKFYDKLEERVGESGAKGAPDNHPSAKELWWRKSSAQAMGIVGIIFVCLSFGFFGYDPKSKSGRLWEPGKQVLLFGVAKKPLPATLAGNVIPIPLVMYGSADLARKDMANSDLEGNQNRNVDFHESVLKGATLKGTVLPFSNFRSTDLTKADLSGAELVGCNFNDAILDGTNLAGSYLEGADLRARVFKNVDLTGVHYDAQTKWPAGVSPSSLGAVLDLEE